MNILIIMDPGILVPPRDYGGHERLVAMFAKEYTRLGHNVSLLVTEGSSVECCTVYPIGKEGFPPKKSEMRKALVRTWFFLAKHQHKFDVIHNFGRLLYLLPTLSNSVRKIMTYGRIVDRRNIRIVNRIPNQKLVFTAPSDWCVNTGNAAGRWTTVYNSIEFSKYTLRTKVGSEAPLIFLSRLERLKGAHIAIRLALATGNKLILAGNISPLADERKYYENEIKPFIDGDKIKYVGALNDAQKNQYLGMAKGMLFPASTDEAFGMVLIEAMACGTPVIGFNKAAVPEVIEEGVTGFVVQSETEMVKAIPKLQHINRRRCREFAEEKFDVQVVAKKYLQLVNEL